MLATKSVEAVNCFPNSYKSVQVGSIPDIKVIGKLSGVFAVAHERCIQNVVLLSNVYLELVVP